MSKLYSIVIGLTAIAIAMDKLYSIVLSWLIAIAIAMSKLYSHK